jgi:hypothetical protein
MFCVIVKYGMKMKLHAIKLYNCKFCISYSILTEVVPALQGREHRRKVQWHIPHSRSQEMKQKSRCVSGYIMVTACIYACMYQYYSSCVL